MTLRMNESDSQQLTEQLSGQVNVNVSKGMSDSDSDSDSESDSESESEILRNYSNSCHHSVNDWPGSLRYTTSPIRGVTKGRGSEECWFNSLRRVNGSFQR